MSPFDKTAANRYAHKVWRAAEAACTKRVATPLVTAPELFVSTTE